MDRVERSRIDLLIREGGIGNLTGDYTLSIRNRTHSIPLFGSGVSYHSIERLGDLDLFLFVSSGGGAKFFTKGNTDTFGTIYDSAGNVVAGGDRASDSRDGKNFLVLGDLPPGEYYLLISGQSFDTVTGDYTLRSKFSAGPLQPSRRSGPDSLVGFSASDLKGYNIYNLDGAGQSAGAVVDRGFSQTAIIVVENDASTTASFSITGTAKKPGFNVRYFSGKTDITNAVVSGTYIIPDLPPGESAMLKAKVSVKSGAEPGAKTKCLITATSTAFATLQDVVQVKVTAK